MNVRLATPADVAAMQRIRRAVKENRLVSMVISDADVLHMMTVAGCGWVAELDGSVCGFAVARHDDWSVWALFVDPPFEARGAGRALHAAMLAWFAERGCRSAWLTTEPGTRAERFYRAAGWQFTGMTSSGEARFEMHFPHAVAE